VALVCAPQDVDLVERADLGGGDAFELGDGGDAPVGGGLVGAEGEGLDLEGGFVSNGTWEDGRGGVYVRRRGGLRSWVWMLRRQWLLRGGRGKGAVKGGGSARASLAGSAFRLLVALMRRWVGWGC